MDFSNPSVARELARAERAFRRLRRRLDRQARRAALRRRVRRAVRAFAYEWTISGEMPRLTRGRVRHSLWWRLEASVTAARVQFAWD